MVESGIALSRLVASLGGGRIEVAEWVDRLRGTVHLWNAVPIALAAVTLMAGGFWLGSVVSGGDTAAAAATRTIHVEGHVITSGGVRYVSTPAQTVIVKGKPVRVAAQTVPLSAAHATQLPGRTVLVATTINDTSVATVVHTVRVPVTVTAPASTVTGPTTTVLDTITVPVISTVTVTAP
jgi:hypothetical protein